MTRAPHQNDLIPIKIAHEFFPRPRATIYRWWKDERFVATLIDDTWCVRLSELREVEARMKLGKVRASRGSPSRDLDGHSCTQMDSNETDEIV